MRRMKLMAPPDHKGQEEEIEVHVDFGLQQLIQLLHRRRTGVQRTHFHSSFGFLRRRCS